ncbi:MAG: Fur family transcriptional regulator [Ktedonobacterales bacterium]
MLDRVAAAGYRVTAPRRRVLEVLRAHGAPATAQEVAEQAGTTVASTYRTLGLLVELGLVSEVPDACGAEDGGSRSHRYALCSSTGHHHHFVCRSCHATVEVASEPLEHALHDLAASHGLHLESHDVMLRGQCGSCYASASEVDAADHQRTHDE